jgi:hypothetical protein
MAARSSYWSENYFTPLLFRSTFTPLAAATRRVFHQSPTPTHIFYNPLGQKKKETEGEESDGKKVLLASVYHPYASLFLINANAG